MEGIQPFAGGPPAAPMAQSAPAFQGPASFHVNAPIPSPSLPPKTPADYLRAVRRRAWMVVTVGILASVAGILLVLRMPAVYRATAEVTIERPKYDHVLSTILQAPELIKSDGDEDDKFVRNKVAHLKSKPLADKVVRDPSVSVVGDSAAPEEAALDLMRNFQVRNQVGTNYYTVHLDGRDPARVTQTLGLILRLFASQVAAESNDALDQSRLYAGKTLETLSAELKQIHDRLYVLVRTSSGIAPGGDSVPKERLQAVNQALLQERANLGNLARQIQLEAARPSPADPRHAARGERIAKMEEERRMLVQRYRHAQRTVRNPDDPYLRQLRDKIGEIDADLDRLQQRASEAPAPLDESEQILASAREEVRALEAEQRQLLEEMKDAHPSFDQYRDLVAQRDMKRRQIAETQEKLSSFEAMARTKKDPVNLVTLPVEPVLPERPKKALYIAAVILFGFGLGVGVAGLMEHVDHSVKVPEHLTSGLVLPLLGVVPRIARTAKVHRGGHLWAQGAPDSPAADAFRNVRASLLGVAGSRGPIVTLLVASAKAGEGKSTTALNLAATCARAGERTLLVDISLRRPSLADVFPHEDGHLGLVDVLRGEMPWQRVVVPTDLPNLDFIPAGDTRQVPVEILGSLELRQLLLSLSRHHYDRVVLDGPPVLGLADCRLLGRVVDATVLVVRSGRQGLRPLQRAKEMLVQSHVRLAGLVFNGIAEGLEDWSSFAPGLDTPPPFEADAIGPGRRPALT